MNNDEIQSLIEQLRATGLDDEKIMNVFYESFTSGEMDRKDLETLAEAMGYELTDEFANDPTQDPIVGGDETGAEGLSKEQLEDAKEIDPNESPEQFKEKLENEAGDVDADTEGEGEEPTDTEESEEGEEADTEEDGEDEDAEWEEAQKLFDKRM